MISRIRLSPEVAYVSTADRVALITLADPKAPVQLLTGTAAATWHLLEEVPSVGIALPELTARLAEQYGAAPEAISADLTAFVDRLLAQGLVSMSTSVSPGGIYDGPGPNTDGL